MYLEHFQLDELPFTLTPNTQYFYHLQGHHAAFNELMLHLRQGEGFIKVTGKVGSGKTLLCRLMLMRLGEDFVTAYIPNSDLEPLSLRKSLAAELGIDTTRIDDSHRLLKEIYQTLVEIHARGKHIVLLIDEAQALPMESLETLRLLTNLETQTSKLLQIVLFGQPELNTKLNHASLYQLRQRIGFSCTLPPLKYEELRSYLCHRLTQAGCQKPAFLFTFSARLMLFIKSKRTPRLLNILCHKSLMSAYGHRKKQVNVWDVLRAVKDTESVSQQWLPAIVGLSLAVGVGVALYMRGF